MAHQAEALKELTDTLVDVLHHESNVLATKAWSKGIIGAELYGNTTLSPRDKVANIIVGVSSRVKTDQTAFDKFIKILNSDSSLEHLAEKLLERSSFYLEHQQSCGTSGAREPSSNGEIPVTPSLKDLLKELNKVASKWENIGIMLDVDSGRLENIKHNNSKSCEECLREMLKEWLKQSHPAPSWKAMVEALDDVEEPKLAAELKEKYCNEQ